MSSLERQMVLRVSSTCGPCGAILVSVYCRYGMVPSLVNKAFRMVRVRITMVWYDPHKTTIVVDFATNVSVS